MGDGGDELCLGLLVLAYLHGHLVYGVHHVADLVAVLAAYLYAVAAVHHLLGNAGYVADGVHHGLEEDEADDGHQEDDRHAHGDGEDRVGTDAGVHKAHTGHVAHGAYDLAVGVDEGRGHGHHVFAGGLAVAVPGGYPPLQRAGYVRRAGRVLRRHAVGGQLNAPAGVDELQLQLVRVLEVLNIHIGAVVVLGVGLGHIVAEEVGGGLGLDNQPVTQRGIGAAGDGHDIGADHERRNHDDYKQHGHHPPLLESPDAQPSEPGFPRLHPKTPTCSRSPTPSLYTWDSWGRPQSLSAAGVCSRPQSSPLRSSPAPRPR